MKPRLSDLGIGKAKDKVIKTSLAVLRSKVFRTRILQFFLLAMAAWLGFWLWGLLASGGLADRIVGVLRTYAQTNRFLAYGFFSGFAMLSVLLGPFTSAPIVPVALLLWGKWVTFALLIAGWMLGGMGSYAVGNYFGFPVVEKLLSRERAVAWRDFAAEKMTFYWALLFRLAMPAETGYIFGMVKFHFWKYVAATFLVEVATGAVLVWGGDALVSRNMIQFAAWIAAGITIFAGAAYLIRKKYLAS